MPTSYRLMHSPNGNKKKLSKMQIWSCSSSCVKSSSSASYALRIKWQLLRVVRLVFLPWLLSHGSKELKWKTSYSSSSQDLLGMQQAIHSRGMRADHPLQEWPYSILASLFCIPYSLSWAGSWGLTGYTLCKKKIAPMYAWLVIPKTN